MEEYGFDPSGNWIDCTFVNPTVIFDSGRAFLRMNGNMEGSEIIAPETEDAMEDVDNFYLVEIGPDGVKGPYVRGGKVGRNTTTSHCSTRRTRADPGRSISTTPSREHRFAVDTGGTGTPAGSWTERG